MGDLFDDDPDERCDCGGHYREVAAVPCTLRPNRVVITRKCDRCQDVTKIVIKVPSAATT